MSRCTWANTPDLIEYHDHEWGVPVFDDNKLFEMLILEVMQAGLSWLTVLRKRESFREAFDYFDPKIVATYDESKVAKLKQNTGIIRHELKIRAAINNANHFLKIQDEFGSFSSFIWNYVDNTPIINNWEKSTDMPSQTGLSEKISSDLSKRGFKFVGPKIVYSFMQASGMVNDHLSNCHKKGC